MTLRSLLLVIITILPVTAVALDEAPPKDSIDVHKMIMPGKVWSQRFKLESPRKVNIRATVKSNQVVDFFVMKPREIRNYIAAGGSISSGNFNHVKELTTRIRQRSKR